MGRFTTIDPIPDEENQESFTPYHYVLNNPVKLIDPDGKNPVKPKVVVATTAGGIIGGSLAAAGTVAIAGTGTVVGAVPSYFVAGGIILGGLIGGGAVAVSDYLNQSKASEPEKSSADVNNSPSKNESVKQKNEGKRRFSNKDREAGFEKSKDASGTPRCEYCDQELDKKPGKSNSYQADHTEAHANGGQSIPENLTPSCQNCNASKGAKKLWTEWVPPKARK